MVIVQLIGGLGNQLFQYACAKSVSIRKNARLILDTSVYSEKIKHITPRNFELSAFNIRADVLSDIELSEEELICYTEDSWCKYDKEIEYIESPCYLIGYWQSWMYFNHISPLIRSDFSFKESYLSSSVIKLGEMLSNSSSVSIHIRRTDYLQYPFINVIPIRYYKKAIEYLLAQIPALTFYVFSDDINWVKSNFDITVQFCTMENKTGIEDLYLMSHCRYNIIANSTYSWWAAWLNCYSKKIVIAPQVWGVGSDLSDRDVIKTDLIPPSWICLD